MSKEFVIPAKLFRNIFETRNLVGDVERFSFDFSPWLDTGDSINSVTWTVSSGSPAIADITLVSNVATALISCPQKDVSVINVKVETLNGTIQNFVLLIRTSESPSSLMVDDYA